VAFLPGSQVDVRPVRDAGPLMGLKQPFQILKMDRRRGNIVVSRRAILEESRAEQRAEVIGKLSEGDVVDGVVKNITEYGAFVDLGGVDGLLHVTDMAWRRVNHPSEILSIGETRQGAGDQGQQGDPPHQPGHEAAAGRSVGSSRRASRSDRCTRAA
jgi:small subunit ribosomal protein S1